MAQRSRRLFCPAAALLSLFLVVVALPLRASWTEQPIAWISSECAAAGGLRVTVVPADLDPAAEEVQNGCPGKREECHLYDLQVLSCDLALTEVRVDGIRERALRGVRLDPGWHSLAVEVPGKAIWLQDFWLPGRETCLQEDLRDFHLVGTLPNAILFDPPEVAWTSPFDECQEEGCRTPPGAGCGAEGGEGLGRRVRIFLDGDFGAHADKSGHRRGEAVVCDSCEGSWRMPEETWDRLAPGFHTLVIQAERAPGPCSRNSPGVARAVKSVRYAFAKAEHPGGPRRADHPWGLERAWKMEGRISAGAAGRSLPPGTWAVRLEEGWTRRLSSVAENFAVESPGEWIRTTDLSRFEGRLDEGGGPEVRLVPRLLPVDRTAGGDPGYRDLLAGGRVRGFRGATAENGLRWKGESWRALRAGIEVPMVTEGESTGPEIYVATLRLRVEGSAPARLRAGWRTQAPAVTPMAYQPAPHRSLGFRLPPGRSERRILLRLSPPPVGRFGRAAWSRARKGIELQVFSDLGTVEVEEIGIVRVEEGFLLETSAEVPPGARAGLYFDGFDRLPSPVRADVPLLDEGELTRLAQSLRVSSPGTAITFRAGEILRRWDLGDPARPVVFRTGSAFDQAGPHASPRPEDVLFDPAGGGRVRRRQEVLLARNQWKPETIAFILRQGSLPRGETPEWRFPGRGCVAHATGEWSAGGTVDGGWRCPDGSLEYELWTSIPALSRGTGWVHTDTFDAPVVTNLWLTKGFGSDDPWLDGHNSRFRADEGMEVRIRLGSGLSAKLLARVRLRGPVPGGEFEADLPAGPLRLPLRVGILPFDLPAERSTYVDLKFFNLVENGPGGVGCDFDSPVWKFEGRTACASPEAAVAEIYSLCADELATVSRLIRGSGITGVQLWPSFGCAKGAEGCGRDRLEVREGRCADPVFNDFVARMAEGARQALGRPALAPGDGWIGVVGGGGLSPAWPYCCAVSESGPVPCPCETGVPGGPCLPNSILALAPGARAYAALATVRDTGLAARGYLGDMDQIVNWGPDRAAAMAVALRSFHDYGFAATLNWFPPDRDQTWTDITERVVSAPGHLSPGECAEPCDPAWQARSIDDLMRLLRWGQWDGTHRCPSRFASDWLAISGQISRRKALADMARPGTYCRRYARGPAIDPRDPCGVVAECAAGEWLDCDAPAIQGVRPAWCPEIAQGPGAHREPLDHVSYTLLGDWFLALQERCDGREGCEWNRPWREENALVPGASWKVPLNSRFSSGFWAGASNVDGFNPYHFYEAAGHELSGLRGGFVLDPFSNWSRPQWNHTGLVYRAESRPAPPGETCDGSCSGIVQTENLDAVRAGTTDLQWWDLLEAADTAGDPRCEALRREVRERIRDRVFPYGVGLGRPAVPGNRGSWLADLAVESAWPMPGYPAESLPGSDLDAMRREVVDALLRIRGGGEACGAPR